MKKAGIGAGIVTGSLLVMWILARLTGILGWYNIPSPSNEPGIMTGDKILTTNLKNPGPYLFVIYKSAIADSFSMQPGREDEINGQKYVHRLCGMPGDVMEMKKGVLYVNEKNFDADLDLKQEFLLPKDKMAQLDETDFSMESRDIHENYGGSSDSIIIAMHRKLRQKYSQRFALIPYIINDTVQPVFEWYHHNHTWTVDNFGPLKIPAGFAFVMGDNRHNSLDSRYTGFIAIKDISGVVINK